MYRKKNTLKSSCCFDLNLENCQLKGLVLINYVQPPSLIGSRSIARRHPFSLDIEIECPITLEIGWILSSKLFPKKHIDEILCFSTAF